MSYCFYNSSFSSLSAIENLLTRVSSITNLDYCFYRTSVDSLNVLNEINMGANSTMNYTFAECPNIRTLNNITISRNVTSVEGMFKGCPLTSISNITVNVNGSIKGLFMGCSQLTTINTFRIPNVTDLSNVFNGCGNLTTLIGFELPSSVTNISNLFNGCYALTTIENFTFSNNITEANTWYPPYLETLQNITINSSAVKLTNCTTLTTIRDFTLGTNDCSSMFEGCTSITSDIELPSTIVNCSNMFKNCTSITNVHSNWDNVYDNEITATDCYVGCTAITHIDNENVISYEGDLGLDYIPKSWGGGGFNAEETSMFEVVIPSDGYTLVIAADNNYAASTNWGDSVFTSDTVSHTYSKSGTYIVKTKNKMINTSNANVTLRTTLTKILKLRKYFTSCNFLFRECKKITSINLDNCELPSACLFYRSLTSNLTELSMVNTKLPSDTGSLIYMSFETPSNITEIRGIEDLDVSHVTSFKSLFNGFDGLTSLDLSRWDTSNATNMNSMFKNCSSLTEPPIKNIPSSVVNTANMYNGCTSLTKDAIIPRSVTDCTGMFNGCTSMTHIHSNWNNSYTNEITATDCYDGCTAITTIDDYTYEYPGLHFVPTEWGGRGFDKETTSIYIIDTNLIGDLTLVLSDVDELDTIDWGDGTVTTDTRTHTYAEHGQYTIFSKVRHNRYGVTHNCTASFCNGVIEVPQLSEKYLHDSIAYNRIGNGFAKCKNLTKVNLTTIHPEINPGEVFAGLFEGCSKLTEIIGLDDYMSKGTINNINSMFNGCSSLKTVNASNWNIPKNCLGEKLFKDCTSLTTIIGMENWNINNFIKMNYMFQYCTSLTSITMPNFNPTNNCEIAGLFLGCQSLTSDKFNISGWHMTDRVLEWRLRLFYDCKNLTELDLSSWVFENQIAISGFNGTFQRLTNCTTINLSSWNLVNSSATASFGFADCPNLVNLNLGNNFTFKGVHGGEFSSDTALSQESAVNILNALADLSGTDSKTLYLPSQVIARLTPSQISIATNKNWNVTAG